MHILLAEDDRTLGNLLTIMLKKAGFTVDWVLNGDEAYLKAYQYDYNVLILDWMMPGKDGICLCQTLRQEGFSGKILILTAKDSTEDLVTGLNSGADDYLVKPFEFAELTARLHALYRRSGQFNQDIIEYNRLRLNRSDKTIIVDEQVLQVTPREFAILDLLLINQGQTLPRELIIDRVWGLENTITNNNLDAHIKLLRKKLAGIDQDIIKTVRGIGYKVQ